MVVRACWRRYADNFVEDRRGRVVVVVAGVKPWGENVNSPGSAEEQVSSNVLRRRRRPDGRFVSVVISVDGGGWDTWCFGTENDRLRFWRANVRFLGSFSEEEEDDDKPVVL